ncbi:U1 snRNP component [Fusarium falciforme]|nr:U1 snRNP component [Fusarium falciforme]
MEMQRNWRLYNYRMVRPYLQGRLPPSPFLKALWKSENYNADKNVSESSEHVKIKFDFKKAIDHSVESSGRRGIQRERATSNKTLREKRAEDRLPFTADELNIRLTNLKESRYVDELVREFLGVYEDELVEYILENIRVNQSKQALLNELRETFDEDGETIADRLWSPQRISLGDLKQKGLGARPKRKGSL